MESAAVDKDRWIPCVKPKSNQPIDCNGTKSLKSIILEDLFSVSGEKKLLSLYIMIQIGIKWHVFTSGDVLVFLQ